MNILTSLPDECLLEIFQYLDVKDLSNAADTCTTFRNIAKEIFVNEFSDMRETLIDEMDKRTLARCLRNFGACMRTYVLNCRKMLYGTTRRYIQLFIQHFGVPEISIHTLTIKNFDRAHKLEFEKPIQSVISRLKTLKLDHCDGLTFSFGRKSTGSRHNLQ